MQTDLWLTETNEFDKCPLCSKLLKRGTQTCYACGFSNETPSVWIDPTARAYQQVMPSPSYSPAFTTSHAPDLTPDPQAASPIWQYESSDFEAAGSLPMLSMFMPEAPTQPQPPVPDRATTRRLPDIDEIDTVPPGAVAVSNTGRAGDMHPAIYEREPRALVIAPQGASVPAETGSRSWTAGAASGSPSARLIARSGGRKRLPSVHPFHPLDSARWWLLRPGRLEFILWLGGTLLLIGVTCLLLLVSALSFQWFSPTAPGSPFASSASGDNAQQHNIIPRGDNPIFTLAGTSSITPGQSFQLDGHGFKPSLMITFYFDGKVSLLNSNHRQAWVRTDARGSFQTTLWLATGSTWTPGQHIIAVRDASGTPLTAIIVRLASSSSNTSTIANSSPTTGAAPGNINTGSATPTGPQGSPVSRPPVTSTPTKTPTPSPTPATPTASPTAKPSPTITPTAKTSPTPVTSPAGGTPPAGVSPTANAGLGNALNDSGVPPTSRLSSVSPLVWIMVACYLLSMFCLGVAGFMHRRQHKFVTKF
jgi:hypothetical protein